MLAGIPNGIEQVAVGWNGRSGEREVQREKVAACRVCPRPGAAWLVGIGPGHAAPSSDGRPALESGLPLRLSLRPTEGD